MSIVVLGELGDLYGAAIRQHRADFQVRTDRLEVAGRGADGHVRAAFELGDVSLADVEAPAILDWVALALCATD